MIRRLQTLLRSARSGRGMVVLIFVCFGLISAGSLVLSIRATDHARNGSSLIGIVARQRTLAERYVSEVLLVRAGEQADPAGTAGALISTVHALLYGGAVPAIPGDDDNATVSALSGERVRGQLAEEARLANDLSRFGSALLNGASVDAVPLTGGETLPAGSALHRLRVLGALTSNVALNTVRSLSADANGTIDGLVAIQIGLSLAGLLIAVLLGWGLVATIRSQTAHYRSLVSSTNDLVFVVGEEGCTFVSKSLCRLVGRTEADLHGDGFAEFVHEYDGQKLVEALQDELPPTMMLRVRNTAGEWRYLEANLTDLRKDRHLRGVVVSSRDVSERVRLEEELMLQTQRDAFGTQLVEALEMADDEYTAYEVIERAMIEIAPESPMELLLSDSSRAHLSPTASSPTAGAPGCPVQSPFECVAVRRGQAVEFGSSEALNACPKLRGRGTGPCSATCVPVSFMGRALGVLHATGPVGVLAGSERLSQLTALATQGGARIGTVRAFEKTQLQAATDALTGLVNRRTFERQVRDLLVQQRPFALAVADLDHFKAINDKFGHEAGDRALRMFAQVTQEALRDGDVLARWGGEEFVFALPEIDRFIASDVLNRMRDRLARAHTGEHPRFTVSFGVTDSTMGNRLETIMQIADGALYESKNNGRDQVTIGGTAASVPAVEEHHGNGNGHGNGHANGRPALKPLLHDAADEEEPRASGAEIR